MRISEVAAAASVNVQTIRFYERRGLLKPPRRLPSGYRDYPAATVQGVRFIKQTQEHGFTLQEIARLLQLLAARSLTAVEARAGVEDKLRALEAQIRFLQALRDELRASLDNCVCRDGQSLCLDLQAIAECVACL
ncbi:MAG TPA: MerR family transcriptional regulator [Blastocatellia bacterium]|nr:MerR family transcriptional regulator [Blastocatellia bacterium]